MSLRTLETDARSSPVVRRIAAAACAVTAFGIAAPAGSPRALCRPVDFQEPEPPDDRAPARIAEIPRGIPDALAERVLDADVLEAVVLAEPFVDPCVALRREGDPRFLRGYPIAGRAVLRGRAVREQLVSVLRGKPDPTAGRCGCAFEPLHALVATKGETATVVLLSFSAGQAQAGDERPLSGFALADDPEGFHAAVLAAGADLPFPVIEGPRRRHPGRR